jgi:hypothetical protein
MKKTIVDINTGEETVIEFTAEEIKQYEKDQLKHNELVKNIQAQALLKESALAKLAALGLSADEIAAL